MSASVRTATLLLAAWVFAIGLGVPQVQAQQPAGKTLYQRLGGYDAVAAVVDDFVGRLATDKAFVRFFGGLSTDSQKRLRQNVVDQFCEATGGPCFYLGRTMKASHT